MLVLSILLATSAVVLRVAVVTVGHAVSLLFLTVMNDECFVAEACRFGVQPLGALDLMEA